MAEPALHKRASKNLCPKFQAAMDVLSRPWNGLVISCLEEAPLRFNELSERMESIGDRMLALRLKELVQLGLVTREVSDGPPVRVVYALTEIGHGFSKVQAAIAEWGEMFVEATVSRAASSRRGTRRLASVPTRTARPRP